MDRVFRKKSIKVLLALFGFGVFFGNSCLNIKAEESSDYDLIATDSDAYVEIIEDTEEIETVYDNNEEVCVESTLEDNEEVSVESTSEDNEVVAGVINIQPIYNGIDYSAVFDYDYYTKKYPDVVKVLGNNPDAVLAHFVNYGMREGRQGNADFNVYSYAYKYPDLRSAFGNDLPSYYNHYINKGKKESRIAVGTTSLQGGTTVYNGIDYSPVYNYDYYTSKYPDIKNIFGLNDTACLKHFVEYGMKEGRRGNENFDVVSYKNSNKDLRVAFGSNLQDYYYHYLRIGRKESRVTNGNTKITDYVTVYNGKDYSAVYDFNYYINKYPDLKKIYGNDDIGALKHFATNGMNEARQAKESFDVWSYGYSYADLRKTFGNNLQSYYEHYMKNGKKEGRKLTANVTSSNNENTVYADYDFSSIYDIVYYTSHNPDVKRAYKFDENAILEHFAQNGLKEGRKALASYSNDDYETAKEKVAEYNKNNVNNTQKYPKAINVLNQIGWDLKAAFNWSVALKYYSGVSKSPDPGINYFGDFGFDNRKGNCYVLAATFYEMAYTMGYNVRQIYGTVPLRAGGQGPHSWVEIDMDGGTYVFDPYMTNETKVNGFKFTYGTPGTWIYKKIGVMHE